MIKISPTSPQEPAVQALIDDLDTEQRALYPPESNHLDSVEELSQSNVHFVGAYRGTELLGCGAVKLVPGGYGEIKRMYVRPDARGQGVGVQIIAALESFLLAYGVAQVRLETGIHSHGALALYRHQGYRESGPFGDYTVDPLSVFFEKQL